MNLQYDTADRRTQLQVVGQTAVAYGDESTRSVFQGRRTSVQAEAKRSGRTYDASRLTSIRHSSFGN